MVAKAILVADDDPDILSIVSMSLETQGYTVYRRPTAGRPWTSRSSTTPTSS